MKISHDIKRQTPFSKTIKRWFSQRSPSRFAVNRFQWHWYPRFFISRNYPLHLDIEISSLCQLHCPMCFREHRVIPNQNNMKWETFRKIIDEAEGRVYSLKFTGRGEPLINPRFPKFMAYLKGKRFGEIGMITNGQLMTEEVMDAILENDLDFVSFSIDGLKEEYERIRAPIRYEEIHEIVSRLHELRTRRRKKRPLIRIQSVDRYVGDGKEFLQIWGPISDDILFLFFKDYSPTAHNVQMKGYACPYIFQRMIVHWDGTVPMCVNDEYETAVRGNILENSLSEIWTGASFQEARQRHIAGQRDEAYPCCAKCAVNRVGHGRETLAARTVLSAYRLLGRFLRPRVVSALEGNRR